MGWNGKFQAVGNGGFAGVLPWVRWREPSWTATQHADTGHVGDDAEFAVGHPPEKTRRARLSRHQKMTVAAKRGIEAAPAARRSSRSFNGCSQGGRRGSRARSAIRAIFDGIVAGAAAWDQIRSHAAHLALNLTMNHSPGGRDTAQQVPIVIIHEYMLEARDGKDGVVDGVLEDANSCTVDFSELACEGGDSGACLTPARITSARAIARTLTRPGSDKPGSPAT